MRGGNYTFWHCMVTIGGERTTFFPIRTPSGPSRTTNRTTTKQQPAQKKKKEKRRSIVFLTQHQKSPPCPHPVRDSKLVCVPYLRRRDPTPTDGEIQQKKGEEDEASAIDGRKSMSSAGVHIYTNRQFLLKSTPL